MRRLLALVFAGERRVWRAAAVCAVPLVALILVYCLKPRPYFTGTDNVETYTYIAPTPAHDPVCVPDLQLPANTAVLRMQLISATRKRPSLHLALHLPGEIVRSNLTPVQVPENRISNADFQIPQRPAHPASVPASLCVTADGLVNWGGTPLPGPGTGSPTVNGSPVPGLLAIWYMPRLGAKRSYLQQAGEIFARAALFRPGIVGPWLYPVLLFLVLPALALLAVRALALAAAGRVHRLGRWLFVIAAINACCWALITPAFQAPDEVDHFAYVQSLMERGEGPSPTTSPLPRWSDAEDLLLNEMRFFSDHQVGDSRPPWLAVQQRHYFGQVAKLHPSRSDGGGTSTSAIHGPIYYLALAPAYLAAQQGSIFSQLTLMRMISALIGALVVLFTFLLALELAPGRPWLAVLAALLVAYEPMYGFISGMVNNDVGVNAAAAALELLLIRLLRRGITIPWGLLTGAVLIALPIVKGTGLSLYPVAGVVFLLALWRHHRRTDLYGWIAVAVGAILMTEFSAHVLNQLQAKSAASGSSTISSNASAVDEALHNIPGFLSYLWQAMLPRLPFMAPHFSAGPHAPGMVIFVERGWAAFGWYDVFFTHWVYSVIAAAMALAIVLGVWALRREWSWVRAHWAEVLAVALMPIAVIAGFEAAFYTPGMRPVIAEFGRYAFPAIGPLAVLAVGALHALGRRRMLYAGVGLVVAMLALSYASQLLTLTSFYT